MLVPFFKNSIQSIKFAPLPLIIFLQGCEITKPQSAPIEVISERENKVVEKPISSESYPLPPTPTIETAYTINNPDPSIINSPQINNADAILNEVLGSPNNAEGEISNNSNSPVLANAGIAANSNVSISTQNVSFNYSTNQSNIDWHKMSANALKQLQKKPGVSALTGSLFINTINNKTNTSLPSYAIDQVILQSAQSTGTLQIIPPNRIAEARNQLGIADNDTLITSRKAIDIGTSLGANYILYPIISGDSASPALKLQLINPQTAEILAESDSASIPLAK